MQYRAIATDIDGTLLNGRGKVTKKTHEAFSYLKSQNIFVFLCSARPPFAIRTVANELNVTTPIIAYNGGLILEKDNEKILHEKYIPEDIAAEIINKAQDLALATNVYSVNHWYVNQINPYVKKESKLVNSYPTIINDFTTILRKKKISKLLLFHSKESLLLLLQITAQYTNYVSTEISKEGYLEILPHNTKKSIALDILAKKYNLSPNTIIAIGDNYNDMDLFHYAGYSIAVGNAPLEVRSEANWVSTSNDKNGFYNAIQWISTNFEKHHFLSGDKND